MIGPESMLYSPQYLQKKSNGTYLLVDPAAPNWISTNKIGAEIVRLCDGRRILKDVIEQISTGHGMSDREASAHCTAFVGELEKKEFVSEVPALKPSYSGRSKAIAPGTLGELWIYTNNNCNLSCLHCLVSANGNQSAAMSADQIKSLVNQAIALGAHRIYFTGGEPFLREDILELVDYVTSRAQLVILSNGTLLDANISRKLKRASNNNLIMQVSLEGPNARINDQIRGQGNFNKAVAGIKELVSNELVPIVTTTITKLNVDFALETSGFLASLGIKDHHILWLHPRGRGQSNLKNLFVSPSQLTETMRALFKNSQKLGMLVDNKESLKVRVKARRGRKNDLCNSCFEMLCVDSGLQVYPCASLNGDPRFACGSLEDQTLEEIWIGSSVSQWIRDNSVQKKVGCNSCYLKFFCGGGCFCQAYYNYEVEKGFGCVMAPDPYCESYKELLEDLLWELAKPSNGDGSASEPKIFAAMDAELPACAVSGTKVTDAAFEVSGFHCACVLGAE
jgi:radical SAM protein with 4Fe4S-binding SPASM domain